MKRRIKPLFLCLRVFPVDPPEEPEAINCAAAGSESRRSTLGGLTIFWSAFLALAPALTDRPRALVVTPANREEESEFSGLSEAPAGNGVIESVVADDIREGSVVVFRIRCALASSREMRANVGPLLRSAQPGRLVTPAGKGGII